LGRSVGTRSNSSREFMNIFEKGQEVLSERSSKTTQDYRKRVIENRLYFIIALSLYLTIEQRILLLPGAIDAKRYN
jgi:hypothetical protein